MVLWILDNEEGDGCFCPSEVQIKSDFNFGYFCIASIMKIHCDSHLRNKYLIWNFITFTCVSTINILFIMESDWWRQNYRFIKILKVDHSDMKVLIHFTFAGGTRYIWVQVQTTTFPLFGSWFMMSHKNSREYQWIS